MPLSKESISHPPKQGGYFTSILSSLPALPNLSLSSITGESGAQQVHQLPAETHLPYGHQSYAPNVPPSSHDFREPNRQGIVDFNVGRSEFSGPPQSHQVLTPSVPQTFAPPPAAPAAPLAAPPTGGTFLLV